MRTRRRRPQRVAAATSAFAWAPRRGPRWQARGRRPAVLSHLLVGSARTASRRACPSANLYAANRCGGLEAQLSTLGDRALSAAVAGREAIPDPGAVVGVFYPDEPDGQGLTAKTMPTIDPSHGVRFLTLTSHFYWALRRLPRAAALTST